MSILVTGGAGYIGSHMVRLLQEIGESPVVADNLSTGNRKAVLGCPLVVADLHDTETMQTLMKDYAVTDVVHFAASSVVPESMRDPAKYYDNNVGGTLSLLRAMHACGVSRIVFSSTAAVYGDTKGVFPITEDTPKNPTSVYGRTKLMIEDMLSDFDAAYGMRSIRLRYFNVAGAHPKGDIGEAHNPETHLIPIALRVLLGFGEALQLYGDDYETADGTCVRDYIHVQDLCRAHVLALKALRGGAPSTAYNLGSGTGFSNRQIVSQVEIATGRKLPVVLRERRPGDPATLVASSERIASALGWTRESGDIATIIASAWKWHAAHPNGYVG